MKRFAVYYHSEKDLPFTVVGEQEVRSLFGKVRWEEYLQIPFEHEPDAVDEWSRRVRLEESDRAGLGELYAIWEPRDAN